MLSFLFEQYGYYPDNLKDKTFFVNGWEFRLIEFNEVDDYVEKIDWYASIIRESFSSKGPFIIKNRYNNKVSLFDNRKFVLVSVNKMVIGLNDLNRLHVLFRDVDKNVDLSKVLTAWESRCSLIENDGVAALRSDGVYYGNNLEISMFCLGMCQNAIQYLSEIIQDYGEIIECVTITHKRMVDFNSFDFFNPFNFVIDHPIRDFVELYRNDVLDFNDLVDVLEYYQIDYKIASFFIARLLYPVRLMDLLEDNIGSRDKDFRLSCSVEKELSKIKKAYIYFKEKYNIRPIDWLDAD